MTNDELPDPILRSVSRLPVLMPNKQRSELMRARCHAKLARRTPAKSERFGPAAVAGFCVVYLSALVHDVLRFRGMF
jgi:hypothetical protein